MSLHEIEAGAYQPTEYERIRMELADKRIEANLAVLDGQKAVDDKPPVSQEVIDDLTKKAFRLAEASADTQTRYQ